MKTGYIAMSLLQTIDLVYADKGKDKTIPIPLTKKDEDILGICIVYRTKTSARKAVGKDVELVKIEYKDAYNA